MHQNVSGVGVEPVDEAPVDEAPIGLYTQLRKTETFEMNVMQTGKLSNFAHIISTYGCLYQYH